MPRSTPGCPGCAARDKKIAKLEKRLAALEERLGQNSKNSHKPPSTDSPDAPAKAPKPKSGRKRGGQLGRDGKKRDLLPPEDIDRFVAHRPETCERCNAQLPEKAGPDDPAPSRHQVFDLPERPIEVTEHQAHACTCPQCGHVTRAEIPEELRKSNFGPRLVAMVSFLTGACQVSRRRVAEIVRDVFRITIALGTISNLEQEAADALEEPYEQAAEEARKDQPKNLDETGWKQQGRKRWLWVAATATVAFFVISTRGAKGLTALLGEKLLGIFTTDRWGVYNSRAKRFRQLCWSHLLRDFQKLVDRGGAAARIGKRAKEIGGDLFLLWKDFKAGGIDRETLRKCLQPLRRELKELLRQGTRLRNAKTATFCKNLLALEPALWTFARCEGVEPTNNHAERVLRTGVLWRKRSFGSQSDNGTRFVERILTAVQSRRLQKRPVFSFLVEAVTAHRAGRPAPSILPS